MPKERFRNHCRIRLIDSVQFPENAPHILVERNGLPARLFSFMPSCQWQDFNWEDLAVFIRRGVVSGRTGDTKTEASQKSLPIDLRLARSLQELWKRTLHQGPQDWVFANKGGRPRGQQNILQRHLMPAALRAGIGKIGWHTFRHSYSTMLRGVGTDIKVQQELLRHSTIQSTLNTYTQAISEQKRAANTIVVGSLFNENASPDQPSANGS
jgi:integrase